MPRRSEAQRLMDEAQHFLNLPSGRGGPIRTNRSAAWRAANYRRYRQNRGGHRARSRRAIDAMLAGLAELHEGHLGPLRLQTRFGNVSVLNAEKTCSAEREELALVYKKNDSSKALATVLHTLQTVMKSLTGSWMYTILCLSMGNGL